MIHTTIKSKILNSIDSFSKGEKKVAEYIITNYEHVNTLSSIELAIAAQVSDTTVIRFAKRLGFKGYLEFKKSLKNESLTMRSPYSTLKQMNKLNTTELIYLYSKNIVNDIEKFTESLDDSILDELCHKIYEANIVYLIGIGSDASFANYLMNYLPLLNVVCIAITEEGLALKEKALNITKNDFVIMSSYPTVQDDEYWIAHYAKSQNAKLAVISNSEIICQKLCTDYSIIANESTKTYYNSCVLTMVLGNIILLKLQEIDPERASKGLKKYSEIMAE